MNGTRRVALALLVVIATLPFVAPFFANEFFGERILRFHSDIVVRGDGSLLVTETIAVRSTGDQIKHGIYRDFPTEYHDREGRSYRVPFVVVQVERDGHTEPYRLTDRENGKRLYIGRADGLLPPGTHTYRLVYRTDHQLGAFAGHTELYWNVTGNGWAFPIDVASASVTLPPGVPSDGVELRGYTGRLGATDSHVRSELSEGGIASLQTTRPLAAGQGLTIVAAWPRPWSGEPALSNWVREHRVPAVAGFVVVALLLFYAGAWLIVGKDPSRGTIIPLYEPPDGLSPAAMRYLRRMGADDKGFSVAIVDLAVHHAVQIERMDGTYTIRRNGAAAGNLPPEEREAAERLLEGDAEIRLTSDNHARVSSARRALQAALDSRYGVRYFRTNGAIFWAGTLLSALLMVMLAALVGVADGQWLPEHALIGFAIFVLLMPALFVALTLLLATALRRWRVTLFGGPRRFSAAVDAVALSVFGAFGLAFSSVGAYALAAATSDWVIAAWAVVMALHVVFQALLPAPTPLGGGVLDRIEGFRRYLGVAEQDRLKLLNPPERTPELFERYLPYALALDVEGAWGEQFAEVVAASSRAQTDFGPSWYHGTTSDSFEPASFASSLGDSLAGAISSASTPPGSSSGSDGGGSSGGGGGGGGGGGW